MESLSLTLSLSPLYVVGSEVGLGETPEQEEEEEKLEKRRWRLMGY